MLVLPFHRQGLRRLPLTEEARDLAPRLVSWRTVVSNAGMAALGSTRRRISIVSPASIACTCSRSPQAA